MCGFFAYVGEIETLDDFYREFKKIRHRGPDNSYIFDLHVKGTLGFHRLSIMDISHNGDQPLIDQDSLNYLVCNGEIYNSNELRKEYSDYKFTSKSDCEVILPLYKKLGIVETARNLDAEFAFVIYDSARDKFFAARDPIGIRPLFYGYSKSENKIMFASEAKTLINLCSDVRPFPPGHYYDGAGKILPYLDITHVEKYSTDDRKAVLKNIRELFVEAVRKRLTADVPIGFLLSGGLDSSLVCAIANKILDTPITTFAVGIDVNPIDTKYAKVVADYLGTHHHEVLFTEQKALDTLSDLIYHLETWDITTIRAAMGMYLVCEYVQEKTDIKVILTGEVSDEIFGYKYTDFAPSPEEFQKEARKRISEIYLYDVLRADRSIAAHSLEARVPFSDKEFVQYCMSIDPKLKMNTTGVGKHLLREAFEEGDYLPKDILYREKAAFSDAVGHRLVDLLKEVAEKKYSDQDLLLAKERYPHAPPFTKESLMYREVFEQHFPNRAGLIKDFWMPNKEWENCNVDDPSARALPNYGKSGN